MRDKMMSHLEITLLDTSFAHLISLNKQQLNELEQKVRKSISSKGYVLRDESVTLSIINAITYCEEENLTYYRITMASLKDLSQLSR